MTITAASGAFDADYQRAYPRAGIRRTPDGRYRMTLWNTEDEPAGAPIDFLTHAAAVEFGHTTAALHRPEPVNARAWGRWS